MSLFSPPRVTAELAFKKPTARGDKGPAVKRAQEFLALSGFPLAIDGEFGGATRTQVAAFQRRDGLPVTGAIDAATHAALVAPMARAFAARPAAGQALSALIAALAAQHVAEHPREAGGDNRGPWVRAYLGWDGASARWCAGFACTLLDQAAASLGARPPIAASASCDTLAERAKAAGRFLSGRAVAADPAARARLVPGSFFLVRAAPADWIHVGVVGEAGDDAFTTFEGNTNDEGSANGYEAVGRARGYRNKDFIVW